MRGEVPHVAERILHRAHAVAVELVLHLAQELGAGLSLSAFFTFGGALHPVVGLFAWWAIFYLPVAVYSTFLVWGGRDA